MSMQDSDSQFCTPSPVHWVFKIAFCAVLAVLLAGLTPALQTAARAQDDPFALGNAAKPSPPENQITLAEISQIPDETTKLVLRTVRESKPQTPQALIEAARVMMDVELYDDARYYLSIVAMMGLDDNQLFELQEMIGSDFFSLIQMTDQLQPEGKTLARKVLTAATKIGLAPARIDQLIRTLNSSDIFVRSEAFRKLRRLGEPAVAELLNVFAQDDRVSDFPGVRGALKSMGAHAQGPLLGAARASDLQVKTEAIRSLGYYQTSEALDVMMRAYLSPNVPEFLRRIALDSLTREKFPADPTVIEQRLYERSREYLLGKRKVDGSLIGAVTFWNWDEATKRLVSTDVDPVTATRIIAARRAADLYEIQPDLSRNREMYLLTQLEAAKRLVGPSRKLNAAALIKTLDTNEQEVEAVLVQALKLELVPAAIACCELLQEIGTVELLSDSSGQPRPLVQAILLGDRHLQYAAMQAIAKIDPPQAYAGSSYMVNLAIYLAQSENRPAGLIGHHQAGLGQTYAATLALSGLAGRSASSSRDFFQVATTDPDIEVLMVSDTLDRPDYADLIQQLRNDWRTRRLPILFLFRDVNRSRRLESRIGDDPLLSMAPFSLKPEFLESHVSRLQANVKPWKLTNLDRRRHGAAALDWLTKIAGDRERYGFYDLSNQQSKLTRLLYLPGFAADASQILVSLGTPSSQRELVNFASQTGLPLEEREKAVEAFVRSVKNNGTLLTTEEIRQQYNRYNASENEPEETQKVFSTILDAIEARRRASYSDQP